MVRWITRMMGGFTVGGFGIVAGRVGPASRLLGAAVTHVSALREH